MTLRLQRVIVVAFAAAALSAACQSRSISEERTYRAENSDGEILVGVGWPWAARQNMLFGQGIDLAVEEVNAAGGIKGRTLRILREDDKETVDEGRLVAQRLASNPDVMAVIGHLHSYITGPAAAIYNMAGMLMVAPASTDPALTGEGYRRVFRTTFTDREVGRQMAKFAIAAGHRRTVVYYVRSEYGRGLANAYEETFTQSGGAVLDRQSYDPNSTPNSAVVARIVDDWTRRDLDVVFIAGEAGPAARLIAEARSRGVKALTLAGDAAGTPELFTAGRQAIDGTIVASPFHPNDPRPAVRAFVDAFTTRYDMAPDAAAAVGYDAVKLLAHGMQLAASPAPEHVATALHEMPEWLGVTGSIRFSAEGDLIERPMIKMVARAGRFEFFAEPPARSIARR